MRRCARHFLVPIHKGVSYCHSERSEESQILCFLAFTWPKLGLPPAISGHQNYFFWGSRDWTGEVILVLDTNDDERELFASVEDLGQVASSPWAMQFERRRHIYLCRDLKMSVRELWPRVKNWL